MRHRRLTGLAIGVLALLGGWTAPAAAAGLCQSLVVPEELELRCTDRPDPRLGDRAVIEPGEGTFRLLSRLSLRQLDPKVDRLAWDDPEVWLEKQMILDLDSAATMLRDLGRNPDSPFGSDMLRPAIDFFIGGIEGLSRLPLAACGEERGAVELTCRFGVEPLGLLMKLMLVAEGEARYAFNIRTFNEQRLRHFTAIANSFAAP